MNIQYNCFQKCDVKGIDVFISKTVKEFIDEMILH
jgi:hypothetical protein